MQATTPYKNLKSNSFFNCRCKLQHHLKSRIVIYFVPMQNYTVSNFEQFFTVLMQVTNNTISNFKQFFLQCRCKLQPCSDQHQRDGERERRGEVVVSRNLQVILWHLGRIFSIWYSGISDKTQFLKQILRFIVKFTNNNCTVTRYGWFVDLH